MRRIEETRNGALLDALWKQVQKDAKKRPAGEGQSKAATIRGLMMPCQRELEADESRYISVRSARRTGKSTGVLYLTLIRCLETPRSSWVIICLTRTSSASRAHWATLKVLNQSFELGIKFRDQALTATLPNGSTIHLVGADSAAEIEKLRGGQYDGVVIDECKSFQPLVFEELIQDVLEPALMDRNGQLYVIGTPGDLLAGPFYLATSEETIAFGPEDDRRQWNAPYGTTPARPFIWSLHAWTLRHNVTQFTDKKGRKYTLWDKALEVRAVRGWDDNHPTWRREYLGMWVASDHKFVYRYKPHVHDYRAVGAGPYGLPGEPKGVWHRVIGFDFGTRDGTAMVVWAYSDHEPGLWELYSEKRTADPGQKLSVRHIAEWYKEVEREFGPFDGWPADWAGLATMVMDTLADEYGVYLEKAEKKEKLDYITLMNSDFDSNLIHVKPGSPLARELLTNRWNEKAYNERDKREEDRATPNDICDAALYAFRWCRHRNATPVVNGPPLGSALWWAEAAARDLAQAKEDARRRAEELSNALDADWWKEPT